jgi:hypothetical protein
MSYWICSLSEPREQKLQVSPKGDASGLSYAEQDVAKLFCNHYNSVSSYYQAINNCSIEDRAKN